MADEQSFRWTSTHDSVERGEVSVLAIVETIASISISLGFALHFQTILHIAFGACVAPLLLLRTEQSTKLGLELTHKLLLQFKGDRSSPLLVFLAIAFPIITIIIRIYSTIVTIFTKPFDSIARIPENWKKVILCLDSTSSPELIPGYSLAYDNGSHGDLRNTKFIFVFYDFIYYMYKHWRMKEKTILKMIIVFAFQYFCIMIYIFAFFIAIFYRLSLKSTSLLWSPLLWIVSSAHVVGDSKYQLAEISRTALYRAMRYYSAVVLIAFVWKLSIYLGPKLISVNANLKPLLEPFVEPAKLPIWQIASALNASLAFVQYFLADRHLLRIEDESPLRSSETTIKWQIGIFSVVRNSLALYTVACTIYIAWKVSTQVEWPVFEFILFPWDQVR